MQMQEQKQSKHGRNVKLIQFYERKTYDTSYSDLLVRIKLTTLLAL